MKNQLDLQVNFHTHTYRCGHAQGEAEEYVLAAIKAGYKRLGFSDHGPFPNFIQQGMRMNFEELENYVKDINSLKEKYKDQIEIYCGVEIEFTPSYLDYYKKLLTDYHLDYLVMGNHLMMNNAECLWYFERPNSIENLDDYINNSIAGLKSGLFSIFAHPDIILNSFTDKCDKEILNKLKILEQVAIENDIPLEINMQGYREKLEKCGSVNAPMFNNSYCYPYESYWATLKNSKVKVIVSLDAHNPSYFKDDNFGFAKYLIEKYNLNFTQNIQLKKI